ncbi:MULTISPECIES: pyridoxal-phosphate dependent enzyme [unclassified Streptomyces]|uniref:PLP-dependent cysteine synthase family protein n=1 Tax=unclassified Streptomyces TaxID=2593676 RepID=UPI002E81E2AB|nr:pyridoxal-phosphate dependent enzyme [Streptomyces sp. NBC_00589]WTI35062.1 pyridoxal-phosphate dependent enzyme [Streptomyces sp. NBC_00775]WUB31264.1 pyridoxal-phosphate dependent enzyme [Streptomyces sp. NBC_00589]
MNLPLLESLDPLGAHAPIPVIARRPAQLVGNTPVLWIDEPFAPAGRGFHAKLEGANPGGIKDRPGLHMVREARRRGDLAPGAPVIESSSGTLGLGLALAGLTYGHPVTVVTDPGMEPSMVRLLTALGAQVDQVIAPHPEGGWQEARRERVAELLTRTSGAYCPDQYHNPDNVAAYRSLAAELAAQLGRVDVLVAAVGTGGHSAGTASVLRESFPDLTLIGVDAVGSTIFGQPAGPRLMRGLGSSIHPANVDYAAFAEVHWVAPAEAVWACRRLARRHYASGGWSVGAVALVAGWAARTFPAGTRIAAIFPDGPHRYLETVYNDAWCAEQQLLGQEPPSEPDEIAEPDECVVTGWTRCSRVRDPLGRTTAAGRAEAGVR